MRNPSVVLTALSGAVLLAACGGGEKPAATGTEAAVVEAAAGAVAASVTGIEVNVDLPDFVARPPSSRAVSQMKVAPPGRIGGAVTFSSTASLNDLYQFYTAKFAEAGIAVQIENVTVDMVALIGDDQATGRSLQVMILPSGEEDGTMMVSLTHSRPDGSTP
jgi:hypothetical protein